MALNSKEGWRRIWLVATGFWSVGWFVIWLLEWKHASSAYWVLLGGWFWPQVGIGIIYFFVNICLPWMSEGFYSRDTQEQQDNVWTRAERDASGNIVITNPDDIEYLEKIMGKAEQRQAKRDSEGNYS